MSQLLDRTQPPQAAPMENILFPDVRKYHLSNGIPVFFVQFGGQEILELNFIFPAGKCFEPHNGVASFTGQMMQEGTENYSGLDYARAMDALGAFIQLESGFESVTVSLTTLAKHLEATSELASELVLRPSFPAEELEKLKQRAVQRLTVEEQKTNYVARKQFNSLLHGEGHPYGTTASREDILALEIPILKAYHARHFHPGNMQIVAAGRFDEEACLRLLESQYGSYAFTDENQEVHPAESTALQEAAEPASGFHYFEHADSMQATVRVGHRAFSRNHPDFYPMQVVNTILGGYFGSRLMKNIREDKGYTYGIGSAWLSMKHGGTFLIQTDVGNAYIQPTLDEIDKELKRLLEGGVDQSELDLVRNYMLGRSTSARETPSQMANLIRNAVINEFAFEEYNRKFDVLMALKPEDIQRLAQQYLHPDQLLKVVCGKLSVAEPVEELAE